MTELKTAPKPGEGRDDETGPNPARHVRFLGLILGGAAFVGLLTIDPPQGMTQPAWRIAAVAVLMAVLWITEALPLAATALIPLAAFPLLGISGIGAAAAPYANPLIFLFFGGFVIALAMERWRLHERIALAVLRRAGNRMDGIVGGFMAATAGLSMWVSNTATALMMLPIALSVISVLHLEVAGTEARTGPRGFAPALLLAIAYGASLGGMATLVGTPPNAFLAGFMKQTYGADIGFAQWLALGLPLAVILLAIVWWLLTRVIYRLKGHTIGGAGAVIAGREAARGPWSRGEKLAACLFAATALAWVTRPLFAPYLPDSVRLDDTVIAITAAVAAFTIPVDPRRGVFLMNWDWAKRLPWDILLLFGGGLTLASGIAETGLAAWMGDALKGIGALPPIVIVLAVIAVIVFLTELTSNTATTAAFLPVMAALAISLGENPLLLVVPAALAASCAFMLPVATPPNAIVFGSGHLTIPQMARAGILLNVAAIIVLTGFAYSLLLIVFGVEPGVLPDWAKVR
ncbi:MAG: DASS family sodium-coupled anion symporter [Alphaproteobacteria bacterium]|nr:DASS family sodium-coupled anion symporter [Alphaproteobacteria bacterium]